jgi:ribonuclease E
MMAVVPPTQTPPEEPPKAESPKAQAPKAESPKAESPKAGPPAPDPGPVLPQRGSDETDAGWGERPEPDDDDRLRQERPPHYDQ